MSRAKKSGSDARRAPSDASALAASAQPEIDFALVALLRDLSGELQRESLIGKLVRVVLGRAGAARCVLILVHGSTATIEGIAESGPGEPRVAVASRELTAADAPLAVVRHVIDQHKAVVLGDAAHAGAFVEDAYIALQRARSVVALPLLRQGRLSGVLYLEDRSVADKFSATAVLQLALIADQAAIALDTARRFADLRQQREAQRAEAMGGLARGIAHDFNNILATILGYGEMSLRETQRGTRLRRNLDNIVTAGERGRALVDRVLAFTTRASAQRVPVPVQDAMREALDAIRAALPPGVAIVERLDAEHASVRGDPVQIRQILAELASNALHAMPHGGTLNVTLRPESIGAPRAASTGTLEPGDYVVLEVADTGTGIAPDVIEHIFEPYFTTKETSIGTGLGLSLVRGIVADAGGAVSVASAPGAGTTLTVYLPRSQDGSDESADVPDDAPHGHGEHILIVDDEEPLVNLVADNLRDLGYTPAGFTSSLAALEACRAQPDHFQALITDERMPGLTGTALVEAIRALGVSIPVLLVSAYVGDEVSSRARAAGVDEVLRKPLARRDLALVLARVLGARVRDSR